MNLKTYESDLRRRLSELSAVSRVAFAVACAERLRTAYSRSLSTEVERLTRRALDLAWECAASGGVVSAKTPEILWSLEERLCPDDEIAAGEASFRAQALLIAVLYALRQVNCGDGDDAYWVARQLTDAIDRQAQSQLDVGLLTTEGERTLETNPSIAGEIRRQLLDLEEASRVEANAASLSSIRHRARLADASLERALGVDAVDS